MDKNPIQINATFFKKNGQNDILIDYIRVSSEYTQELHIYERDSNKREIHLCINVDIKDIGEAGFDV